MHSLRSNSQTPGLLRYSVRAALKKYFSNLDGEPGAKLYDLVMQEVESPLLEVVMEQSKWNQSTAAKWLGISRGTLRKLLERYQITKVDATSNNFNNNSVRHSSRAS